MVKTPSVNDILILTKKTRRGLNALQNKINRWKVLDVSDSVTCLNGPGFLLQEQRPEDDTFMPDMRWLKLPVDDNFDWEKESD